MARTTGYSTISREELRRKLEEGGPNNEDAAAGYAVVNVLPREKFVAEHIPKSINIPQDEQERFGRKFDLEKEIIVYCASQACPASTDVAKELVNQGFRRVRDFEGGVKSWKEAGYAVSGGSA